MLVKDLVQWHSQEARVLLLRDGARGRRIHGVVLSAHPRQQLAGHVFVLVESVRFARRAGGQSRPGRAHGGPGRARRDLHAAAGENGEAALLRGGGGGAGALWRRLHADQRRPGHMHGRGDGRRGHGVLHPLHVTHRPRLHRGQRQVTRQRDDGGGDVYIHHWYLRVGAGLESGRVGFTGDGVKDAERVLLGAQLLALRGLVRKHGPAGVHARRVAAQGLLHDGALVGDRRGQRHVSPSHHDAGRLGGGRAVHHDSGRRPRDAAAAVHGPGAAGPLEAAGDVAHKPVGACRERPFVGTESRRRRLAREGSACLRVRR